MKKLTCFATAVLLALSPVAGLADPNPDSAAGACGGGGDKNGLGDTIGKVFVPNLKAGAEAAGVSLGQHKKAIGQPPGYGVPEACAPGKPS